MKVWKVTKETVSEFKKSANKYAVLAEESMQNEGTDPTVDSRKILDEFVKNRRQPSLNETQSWTYFKYQWEAMQNKELESEDEEDVEQVNE